MSLPYKVRFKLPLEFLTLQDWNNFVQNLLFINQYGSAKLLQYYQNGNFQNINDVIAKYLYVSALKVMGYNVLHNLSQPQAYTFGEGKQQPFESMANRPTVNFPYSIPFEFIQFYPITKLPSYQFPVFPVEKLKVQLSQVSKQLQLLIPKLISKIVTPQFIAGTQFTFSGTATVEDLVNNYLNPQYLQTWREIIIQNLGTSAVQINNAIYLMPKNCLKITASSPSEIQLTAQTPTLLSEEIEFTAIPTVAYTITITNNQPDPTPSPFQQLLNLNLSSILSSSSQLLNLEFCLDINCNTPLYAWIESYNSNLSTVYIWINLPVSIPANSSITIYMFVRNLIQYPYTGMAPQLTSTYAQYDNGENVFTFYDNFAGTSLNTNKWASYTSGTTITVNNGLTIQSSASFAYGGIITLSRFPTNTIFDTYLSSFTVQSSTYNSAHGIGVQTGNSDTSNGYQYTSWNNKNPNGGTISYGPLSSNTPAITAGPNFPTSNSIISGYWLATGNEAFGVNYSFVSITDTSVTNTGNNYYVIGAYYGAQSGTSVWYWARVRAYPPNGVMPSNSQPQKTIILVG